MVVAVRSSTERDDATVSDPDLTSAPRRSRPVDELSASKYQIEHQDQPFVARPTGSSGSSSSIRVAFPRAILNVSSSESVDNADVR